MPSVPPSQPGIRIRITSPYKGGSRSWSNTWYLTGPAWANQAHFDALADEYVSNVKTWLPPNSTIVEAIAYNAGSFLPVFSKTYTTVGTATLSGATHMPLDSAMLVRGNTDARTSKNHPIYIMKYVHAVAHDSTSIGELPLAGQKSALQGSVNEFIAGVSDGTNTRKWCGPRGAVVLSASVETYVTHRDFP